MEKKLLVKELIDLEMKISMYENAANNNYFGNSSAQTAKNDLQRVQYSYKKLTMDLSDEEKEELIQLAAKKNVQLNHIFELVFSEEEKEEYQEVQSFWEKPMSQDIPELEEQLDKEEEMKIKEKNENEAESAKEQER